jgi:hypothetical protein
LVSKVITIPCMILMVMESFSIVLGMVVSETYSLNK